MDKLKKVFLLMLIVAIVSLGVTGCKSHSEHPAGEHPAKEAESKDHPAGEHPSK